jgi:hypothetical protein
MVPQEADYRGYKILLKSNGKNWIVSVCPKNPELPILRWNSFQAPLHSPEDAIAEARRRIDQLLSL